VQLCRYHAHVSVTRTASDSIRFFLLRFDTHAYVPVQELEGSVLCEILCGSVVEVWIEFVDHAFKPEHITTHIRRCHDIRSAMVALQPPPGQDLYTVMIRIFLGVSVHGVQCFVVQTS
jgi:hypothetical protein